MDQSSRPHRPAPYPDLTALIDAAGGTAPSSRAEIAATTAAMLVRAGREAGSAGFVALADEVGIDTLAALWQDAEPVSLPGALFASYLLRQWLRSDGEQVRRLWQAGAPLAPADAVVAGLAEPGDVASVHAAADTILAGMYRGDFAVALERAAAVFRVVAAGRRFLAGPDERGETELALADRNDRVATDLAAAARRWRAGTLS